MIVTVAYLKGGTGKTTTVAHLALAWSEEGRWVCWRSTRTARGC